MDPVREIGRWLMVLGLVLVATGGLLLAGGRLPFRLGHLPGDIIYHGRNSTIYFPIVTCIVFSVVLTIIFWAASLLRR